MSCGSSSKSWRSLIFAAAKDGIEKIDGGVLLKFEAVANAVGSVEQQADAQRNVRLAAEVLDGLRTLSSVSLNLLP